MDGERLILGPEVRHGAEGLSRRDALRLPPERDLTPAGEAHDRPHRKRRVGHPAERDIEVRDSKPLGECRAVAVVAIDELQDAGGLAEGREPFFDLRLGHRIDEPIASVVRKRVGGPLEHGRLGRDPPDPNGVSSQILIVVPGIATVKVARRAPAPGRAAPCGEMSD